MNARRIVLGVFAGCWLVSAQAETSQRALALNASETQAGDAAAVESTAAAQPRRAAFYGLVESFTWKEEINGERLLKESGPLFGIGARAEVPASAKLWLACRGELFLGEVDYDGSLQDEFGHFTPYSSETSYVGLRGAVLATTPLQGGNPSIAFWPQAGLGFYHWIRSLDKKLSDDEVGEYGYEETWSGIHAILGGRITLAQSSDLQLFGSFELRLPVWNSEVADLSENGGPDDIELEPDEQVSFYADAGINKGQLTLAIYGETLEYDQSPLDDTGSVLQPDSTAVIIGGKVGMVF